jgi:ribonuclease VapC
MFIDASALIAMLTDEEEGDALADALAGAEIRLTSAIAFWEAVAGLVRTYVLSVSEARAKVEQLLSAAEVRFVSIGEGEFSLAVEGLREIWERASPGTAEYGRLLCLCLRASA